MGDKLVLFTPDIAIDDGNAVILVLEQTNLAEFVKSMAKYAIVGAVVTAPKLGAVVAADHELQVPIKYTPADAE